MPSDPIDVFDPLCHACEYPLRALPSRGRCPECGASYDVAHIRWLLAETDGAWRRGLAWGAILLAVAALIPIIDQSVMMLAATRLTDAFDGLVMLFSEPMVRRSFYVLADLLAIAGILLFTRAEVGSVIKRRDRGRRPARWIYLIAHSWSLVMMAVSTVISVTMAFIWFSVGLQFLLLIGTAFLLAWISHLAARLPHPGLAWLADVLMVVLLVSGFGGLSLEWAGTWAQPIVVPLGYVKHLANMLVIVVLAWMAWEIARCSAVRTERGSPSA